MMRRRQKAGTVQRMCRARHMQRKAYAAQVMHIGYAV